MLTLASSSETRQTLLRNAAIPFEAVPARIDEDSLRDALLAEGHGPRNVADALAEMKALRLRRPGLILGCDQICALGDDILTKPATPEAARAQLTRLSGGRHKLHSAAVIVEDGTPIWRHIGDVTMIMRPVSDVYISDYVERNWDTIRHSAGSYTLEGEGARLFQQVQGDFFSVLGLPLLPLINYLVTRGDLPA
ncbi:nucleoside triphosphate pyrophosphatase [Jannaschia sp. M317]|uniref:Maf family protein n=1 Tax=Jannaschia sp. M317 TaxID=2867011 RepID=UPI0021A2EBC5|nr:nucleoside triphosphate pyrophosphatase [Jannaschia sp. M317]UWQ18321.1 Maf family protein [Jannaschia sp. M317]